MDKLLIEKVCEHQGLTMVLIGTNKSDKMRRKNIKIFFRHSKIHEIDSDYFVIHELSDGILTILPVIFFLLISCT